MTWLRAPNIAEDALRWISLHYFDSIFVWKEFYALPGSWQMNKGTFQSHGSSFGESSCALTKFDHYNSQNGQIIYGARLTATTLQQRFIYGFQSRGRGCCEFIRSFENFVQNWGHLFALDYLYIM